VLPSFVPIPGLPLRPKFPRHIRGIIIMDLFTRKRWRQQLHAVQQAATDDSPTALFSAPLTLVSFFNQ
jgi:hypothetical protein